MPRDGARTGAKSATTTASCLPEAVAAAEAAAAADPKARARTPLHVIVQVYSYFFERAFDKNGKLRDRESLLKAGQWAKEAAPYMHPKLAAVNGRPGDYDKSHEDALRELE